MKVVRAHVEGYKPCVVKRSPSLRIRKKNLEKKLAIVRMR